MDNQLHASYASLPLRGALKTVTLISTIVAVFMTAASLGGLLYPSVIYPTEELRQSYLANDVVNLLVGLPILLGSLWLVRRGTLVGLLCLPGALLYTFYNYIAYVVGMPLGLMTLVFTLLVLLSAYPTIELLQNIDGDTLKKRLAGAVSEKISGGVLVIFGLAFFALAIGVFTRSSPDQILPTMTEIGVAIADMILSILLAFGGVLLFQRKPLGYASGLGLLFAASMLFIGVILVVVLQPLLSDAPFALEDVIVLSVMGLICFIPTGLFMRGVLNRSETAVK